MGSKIFGAYGSFINKNQMRKMCRDAKLEGKGVIKGYKLTFRGIIKGYANVEIANGRIVPVVLWSLTNECEKKLDKYIGYPGLYIKQNIKVLTKSGDVDALVYKMLDQYCDCAVKPLKSYINNIIKGYKENELPLEFLNEAIAENIKEFNQEDKEYDFKDYKRFF
jgi:hypothetical protein